MTTPFLFINEDQISYVHRPRGVSSLVRGHARKYRTIRTVRHARRENYPLPTRRICAKELENTIPEDQIILTSPHHEEETESGEELFADLHRILDIVPGQILHYRILQLDSETRRLIHFYLLWSVPQAHSGLPCAVSWPKTIVTTAFNSELHSLVLLCYIASLVSYLSQGLSKSHRKVSQPTYKSTGSDSYFDSDSPMSPQSSQSPASSLHSVVPQIIDPSNFDRSPSTYSWDIWETWRDTQMSNVTQTPSPQTSSTQTSSTQNSAPQNSPGPAPQQDPALSTLPSPPSQSINDECLPIPTNVAHLTHLALTALQSRLSTKNKPPFSSSFSSDLLFPVWCLFRAAIFQGDEVAAVSHERFLRHLIYRLDGSKYICSRLVNVIIEVDLKLCLTGKEKEDGCALKECKQHAWCLSGEGKP